MTQAPVVVIDLQTGMFDGVLEPPVHDGEGLVERTRAVIDWARRTGHKVAFVQHHGAEGDPFAPGQPGWALWPALGQAADEPTFAKTVGDAFSNPEFGAWVAAQGAGAVVLLGAQSDYCVTATLKGAIAAGLRVVVVSDAHSTLDGPSESAAAIIARCNTAFAEAGAALVTTEALTGG